MLHDFDDLRLVVTRRTHLAQFSVFVTVVAVGSFFRRRAAAAQLEASGEYLAPRGELAITAPIVFGRWRMLPLKLRAFLDFAAPRLRRRLA